MYTEECGDSKNGPSIRLNAELSERNGPANEQRGPNQKQALRGKYSWPEDMVKGVDFSNKKRKSRQKSLPIGSVGI